MDMAIKPKSNAEKILSFLQKRGGGASEEELCRHLGLDAGECKEALDELIMEDKIRGSEIGKEKIWGTKKEESLYDFLQGRYSLDALKLDEEKGEIKSITGSVVAIISREFFAQMYSTMEGAKYGSMYLGVVKEIGRGISLKQAEEYKKVLGIKPDHYLVHLEKIINAFRYHCMTGWGKLEEVVPQKDGVVLRLSNTFESSAVMKYCPQNVHEPTCGILLGRALGLFEGFTGEQFEAKETACRSLGSKYCEFSITLKKK
ncbi:V4R domain protein [Candidatus Gugararchaeum adminiculabundum]|nr:V4R domain protein [Candidatus Gugararchaeum adminiculabundum]